MMRRYFHILSVAMSLVCVVTISEAKDFGKHGAVYEISETPIYEMITNSLKKLQKEGKFDEVNETLMKNSVATIESPKAVEGLGSVLEAGSYIFDPSITLQEDIDDGRGNIIATAGTTVNPLEHVALGDELLFIHGERKSHVKLAEALRDEKNGKLKIIYVSGEPLNAMREGGYRVYFDQGGNMVRRFQITRVPALVTQEGLVLRIMEIPADEL